MWTVTAILTSLRWSTLCLSAADDQRRRNTKVRLSHDSHMIVTWQSHDSHMTLCLVGVSYTHTHTHTHSLFSGIHSRLQWFPELWAVHKSSSTSSENQGGKHSTTSKWQSGWDRKGQGGGGGRSKKWNTGVCVSQGACTATHNTCTWVSILQSIAW